MHTLPEVVLRGIPASGALERYIGEQARRLEGICGPIRSFQVLAEALRPAEPQAAQVAVRLSVALPGTEVVVNREHASDVYIALRDAFAAAGVQLRDHVRRGKPGRGAQSAAPPTRS